MNKKIINIAMLGCGTVGQSVVTLLRQNAGLIAEKTKFDIRIAGICVRNTTKNRGNIDPNLFKTDYLPLVADPAISLVVELMGDCPDALDAIKQALKNGKSVVTANKALIARHALELFDLARANHCEILFGASVCGGIPIIRTLREGLVANKINSLLGILNGTTNYILTQMTTKGKDLATCLAEAQKLGYAEADPTADIEGHDAAHKLAILAMLCYGKVVSVEDIFCKGITYLTPLDIGMADKFGYVIKSLGIIKQHGAAVEARVHPTMIRKTNSLATVGGASNAVQYHGDFAGEGMLYGLGAGGNPTASAVVSDIIELARNIQSQNAVSIDPAGFIAEKLDVSKPRDILDLRTRYYIRFSVFDKPQVLANITAVLGAHNISIQHLYQHGEKENDAIPIIVFTHEASEREMRKALKQIDNMNFITQMTKIVRIEEGAL